MIILEIIIGVSALLMILFTIVHDEFHFFLASVAFAISIVLFAYLQASNTPAEKPSTVKATYVQIDTVYTIANENIDTTYFITYDKAK